LETGTSPVGERVREVVPLPFPLLNHRGEVAALRAGLQPAGALPLGS